ncbi:FtsH protease activity modulator HflK [uncultured Sphingomonas sp.]|uniref:FtsH protease activity modulator HflK n=1 Tax=uncultured Sphingomonas sp. TaxID=158754 RepID=UPI0025F11FAA|nr:FtsH protease activity modulator HflK [uncultured Sphingomonas sp.]
MQDGSKGATLNDSGPWGGSGGTGDGPKKPWRPTPGRPAGPSALDALLRRGRARFGGNGPQNLEVGNLWRWAIIGMILLWVIFTSAHTIGPQQRGVITRLGKYVGTLQPGLGFTFPAPMDLVTKVDVDTIHVIDIDTGSDGASGQNLMLTGDENIINLAYSVRWSIRDPELYLFELQDPDGTIKEVAESAMREAIARVTLNDAIGQGRSQIEARVAQRAQELLDSYRAGVVIQGVAIKQADPPQEVLDAFKEVSAAQQTAQSYLNQARAYATQVTAKAEGEATAFDKVYEQYKLAPDVTRRRMYYETMEKVLAKSDKTIVGPRNVVPYLPAPAAARAQEGGR